MNEAGTSAARGHTAEAAIKLQAQPLRSLSRLRSTSGGALVESARTVPEESAVAFVYDGDSHGVMMATPADLEDFAVGWSLSEAKIDAPEQIAALAVHESESGIELRMSIDRGARCIAAPKQRLVGPTGCGLCGVKCLDDTLRPLRRVQQGVRVRSSEIARAMRALSDAQQLNRETRALHAAGFWQPGYGLIALREDVGRHNALDKLAGTLARQRIDGSLGMVLVTSRVSVELVQKAARLGAPLIAAVSAPTALAVRTAHANGITLVALARDEDFEVFSHAGRIEA